MLYILRKLFSFSFSSLSRSAPSDPLPRHQLAAVYLEEEPTRQVHLVPRHQPRRLVRLVPPVLVLQLRPRPPPLVLRPLPLLVEDCSAEELLAAHLAQLLPRRRPALVVSARLLLQLPALASLEALRRLLRLPVSVGLVPPAPHPLPICLALPPPAWLVSLELLQFRMPSRPKRMAPL